MSFYYVLMALSLTVVLPFFLLPAKRRAGILQKLGFVPRALRAEIAASSARPSVWFHAVSVGEFSGALPMVQEFAARNPQYRIFVSTTTATGQALAKKRLSELIAAQRANVFYFPFDLPFALGTWLDLIKPKMAVIVETEIWPGFTYECKKRGVKLAMINARMSPRSFNRYMAARAIFAPVIRRFDLIAAQSSEERERFFELCGSVEAPKIEATGNLKYDRQVPLPALEIAQLRKQLNLADTDKVIVAGSTHEGEEAALLEVYTRLVKTPAVLSISESRCIGDFLLKTGRTQKVPRCTGTDQEQMLTASDTVRLILVPRHPERWENVCRLVESHGFKLRRYSRGEMFSNAADVYVLDTIGQLTRYYAIATAAFVGGTMVPVGGHNLVEPYVCGVPVVCGSHLFKTRDVARQLEEIGALTVVHNNEQLEIALAQLLQDDALRQKRAQAGSNWLKHSKGAIAHTLELLESVLNQSAADIEYRDNEVGRIESAVPHE